MTALPVFPVFPALSLLDLAIVAPGERVGDALRNSVETARLAELGGYQRVWFAEHHNMGSIASSATAVLIGHVAAHTTHIRVGAGGIMLPNHSPLIIAEQFGTLAELHPGRIDLGVGRAPGSDGATFRALRRSPLASEQFPADVRELQRLLSDEIPLSGVNAFPGRGTEVPVYVLGSSLFGANLAAQFGLPYAFASHFAPHTLHAAVQHYRDNFVPSAQLDAPYVLAGLNVVAAETDEAAAELFARAESDRVRRFLSRGRESELTAAEAAVLYDAPAGREIRGMLTHRAVGSGASVRAQIAAFAATAQVDEVITTHLAPTHAERMVSIRLTAGFTNDDAEV